MFSFKPRQTISAELTQEVADMEDFGKPSNIPKPTLPSSMDTQKSNPQATKRKLTQEAHKVPKCNFKETLGNPPKLTRENFDEW